MPNLAIREFKDLADESISNLFSDLPTVDYAFTMYPPVVVRYQGRLECVHKLTLSIPTPTTNGKWVHSKWLSHAEMTPDQCATTVAEICRFIGQEIMDGTLRKLINKKTGIKDPEIEKEEKESKELKNLLKSKF